MALNNVFSGWLRRQKYRFEANDPRVIWAKHRCRDWIRTARMIPAAESVKVEAHVLASERDSTMLLWSLYSLSITTGNEVSFVIHDDGTITDDTKALISSLFEGARVISRRSADLIMQQRLRDYPRCATLRRQTALALKIFDIFEFAALPNLLLLDTDVAFFSVPDRLLEFSSANKAAFIRDVWSNYLLDGELIAERIGMEVPTHINVGCGVIPKDLLDLQFIEEILAWPEFESAPFFCDQTILAILAARRGVTILGDEYQMTLAKGVAGMPLKHYTRLIRPLFYTEGIPKIKEAISKSTIWPKS